MGIILRKAILFFGSIHLALIIFSFWSFILSASLFNFLLLVYMVYFFPICVYRLQNKIVPLREGKSDFNAKSYCPWWGAHQIQQVYSAVPFLEGLLRIVPGLYSFWLRLWGSTIGKQVYWTPRVEIVDRSLLIVGDYCIFGHRSACSSHIINQKDGKVILQVTKVRLGKSVFVGAGVRLGPGTLIADKITIPIASVLLIDQHVTSQEQLKAVHHDPIPRPHYPEAV